MVTMEFTHWEPILKSSICLQMWSLPPLPARILQETIQVGDNCDLVLDMNIPGHSLY